MKNLKQMLTLFLVSISIIGCQNDDLELNANTASQEINYSKISELPEIPGFANPITKNEEIRKFGLLTDKNEKLLFKLKPIESNIFGKKRVLSGTVQLNEKKEVAAMIVGEDGFELLFTVAGERFFIKKYNNIDIGYINPLHTEKAKRIIQTTDFKQKLKKSFASKGMPYNQQAIENLLYDNSSSNTRSKVKNRVATYSLSKQEDTKNHQNLHCGADASHALPDGKNQLLQKTIEDEFPIIDVVAMESNFPLANHLITLIFNFLSVFPDQVSDPTTFAFLNNRAITTKNSILPLFSNAIITGNTTFIIEYITAIGKRNDSSTQLSLLRAYANQNLSQVRSESMYATFYNSRWDDCVLGRAYVNTWKSRNAGSSSYAAFISSGNSSKGGVTSHEWSHVMGANHTTNGDVMNSTFNNALLHLDPTNIQKIRTSVGL